MISGGTFTRVMNQPLTKPGGGAGGERHDDRGFQRQAQVLPAVAEHDRAQPHDRADREIDAAGDDDEGHGQRHQPDLRHQPALVEQVVDGQESVALQRQHDQRRRQDR